jgi:hypothetical protein
MKSARRQQGKSAFDLIEEATHLLRSAPPATLAIYFLGAIPFVLGFLFFWADMSRSPFANQHLVEAGFALALLFFWMKFCQTIFARRLRAQIAAEPPPRINFRRALNFFLAQTILQPCGLFLIPLSLPAIVPFAWTYAFFQNVTALADGDEKSVLVIFQKARRQTALWPRQNFFALGILLAFAFYVFLNWTIFCFLLPQLFKMLLGLDSIFVQSPMSLFNTTFFAAMFALTYLCVDPIFKTFYVLRCFYGESLHSGEDLKSELKSFSSFAQKTFAAIFICAIFLATAAKAQSAAAPAPVSANQKISPADLDRVINQTVHERKFTWRMPREQIVQVGETQGVIGKFFDQLGTKLRQWARELRDWWRKLFQSQNPAAYGKSNSDSGWAASVQMLLYILIAVAVGTLAVFLYRVWRGRQKTTTTVAQPIFPAPDLADENVRADQLPEDGWIKLARELLARGELRLAMRAFYLASLAHLSARNLISIARFKSNRDYERELGRRAHSFPNLLSVFGENIFAFERIWYGAHEVNLDSVNHFASNVEKIKAGG